MDYQKDKKNFYIFLDVHNALTDIKYFNMIKKTHPYSVYEESINPHSMEIFNALLKHLGQYYNIEIVLTQIDAEYAEHLLRVHNVDDNIIHTIDYLFSKDEDKSKKIVHYLTMFRKDNDVSKINNYIIFDINKIELNPYLKKHLVDINPKTNPLSEKSLNETLKKIGLPILETAKENDNIM